MSEHEPLAGLDDATLDALGWTEDRVERMRLFEPTTTLSEYAEDPVARAALAFVALTGNMKGLREAVEMTAKALQDFGIMLEEHRDEIAAAEAEMQRVVKP